MTPWYKKRTHVHTVNTSFNRVFVISVTLLFKQLAFASCYFFGSKNQSLQHTYTILNPYFPNYSLFMTHTHKHK